MKQPTTTTLLVALLWGLAMAPGAAAADWVCYDENGVPHTSTADNDHDGQPDCRDLDDDGDTISDRLEAAAGTDPMSNDSDGDGIPDPVDLDPSGQLSILLVRVNMAYIAALDRCGDGDAWDPYFGTAVLDVIGQSFKFTGTWGASNHLEDQDEPIPPEKLPKAFASVPSDFRAWDLNVYPMPWSTAHVGLYDYDFTNSDDRVHLSGASFDIAQTPLSLVTGKIGHASSGSGNCRATVSLSIHKGLGALENKIGELSFVRGYDFVDCPDVGLGTNCDMGGSGSTGSLAGARSPLDRPMVHEDLYKQSVSDGHVALQVFAPDVGTAAWDVLTEVNGASDGWRTLEPGYGYTAATPAAGDLDVRISLRPAHSVLKPVALDLAFVGHELAQGDNVLGVGLVLDAAGGLDARLVSKEGR